MADITFDNPKDVPPGYLSEVSMAALRARNAGARGRLRFVGIGQYGVVFCDERNHAWKVFRRLEHPSPEHRTFTEDVVRDEYEWLKAAAATSIRKMVPRVYGVDLERHVIERDCIQGRPGSWADEGMLFELHKKIDKVMIDEAGWTAPEFKGDSYIISKRGPILADASMAQRVGMTLLRHVQRIISGEILSHDRPRDLAFFILREIREGTLTSDQAKEVLRDLVHLDPNIATAFGLQDL